MKSKFILGIMAAAFCFSPLVSSAETDVSVKASISADRAKAKAELEVRKKELEERREETKKEMEAKREEFKDDREEKREEIKTNMEERRENIKNTIQERKDGAIENIKSRLQEFAKKTIERYEAAIERLEKLETRIDSRIVKMEAEGIDVVKAKELIEVAKIKIETAKTSVAGISIEADVAVTSDTSSTTDAMKNNFQTFKGQLEKAKNDIKAAHAALVEVVKNLKPGLNARATTTVEVDDN